MHRVDRDLQDTSQTWLFIRLDIFYEPSVQHNVHDRLIDKRFYPSSGNIGSCESIKPHYWVLSLTNWQRNHSSLSLITRYSETCDIKESRYFKVEIFEIGHNWPWKAVKNTFQ